MSCHCYTQTKFANYDKSKDRLGTEWDDFGYAIYKDQDGIYHTAYFHQHLGIVDSYRHFYIDIPDDWVQFKEMIDNTCFPLIKSMYLEK
jgi:hypothetical protein